VYRDSAFGGVTEVTRAARKPPTFEGRHNASKVKAWLMLAYSPTAEGQHGWLSARQLHRLTGLPHNSLLCLLPRWCGWGYVERGVGESATGRPLYFYRLTGKGYAYLEKWERMLPLSRYEKEMNEARARLGYEA